MTSYERVVNTLNRKPVDQCPIVIGPWEESEKRWIEEGHYSQGQNVRELFDMDLRWEGILNMVADLDCVPETVEETEDTISMRDGNGAVLRKHKGKSGTPEHVDFRVKNRQGWEELIKPFFQSVDKRRIPYEKYRSMKKYCAEKQLFLFCGVVAPFELMHPVCGHENLLVGMALDPEWIQDMVKVYSDSIINHLEELFSKEGKPDGFYFFEDMGFRDHPFFSTSMYRELIKPGHVRIFDFAHSCDCKVMMHSCGFIEPLLDDVIDAGLDCLQGMEAKAGMDLAKLHETYGKSIAFCGGVDARALISNDRAKIDAELDAKVAPVLAAGGGYILSTDHSEPPEIDFDTLRYFIEKGREMSRRLNKARIYN